MTMPNTRPLISQRGSTLIVALVFLMILTMLGVTVAGNNVLQERMAGNTRQRDLAFQAAEHALKAADTTINNPASAVSLYMADVVAKHPGAPTVAQPANTHKNGDNVAGINPYTIGHNNDINYWNNTFQWTDATSTQVTGISSSLTAANPRYTIEQMPPATCPEDATKTCFYFRVTAHGEGKDSNADSIVQSMYKFKP